MGCVNMYIYVYVKFEDKYKVFRDYWNYGYFFIWVILVVVVVQEERGQQVSRILRFLVGMRFVSFFICQYYRYIGLLRLDYIDC